MTALNNLFVASERNYSKRFSLTTERDLRPKYISKKRLDSLDPKALLRTASPSKVSTYVNEDEKSGRFFSELGPLAFVLRATGSARNARRLRRKRQNLLKAERRCSGASSRIIKTKARSALPDLVTVYSTHRGRFSWQSP